ncbi:MAG TPA: phosphoenolpyruvate--protein phosphotransferase [Caproiciproducens sp.]|nr:phosphoenolpyruvate--protein phosphotransferase [Caproiciproducens sp.]
MITIKGIGASNGIAIGKIALYNNVDSKITKIKITDVQTEIKRVTAAREKAENRLNQIYLEAMKRVGEEHSMIFQIHIMMLQDEDYFDSIKSIIINENANAEYAVWETGQKFSKMFAEMDDSYMRARSADVIDISNRLLRCLQDSDESDINDLKQQAIIAAADLMPSETIQLDQSKVLAVITQKGSQSSHSAILARTIGIPAVVGLGEEFEKIQDGMSAVIDGFSGQVILEPDEQILLSYSKKQREFQEEQKELKKLKGTKAVSKDGIEIEINANIGHPGDADLAVENDADGIGLFRSEFLYMESSRFPTEDEQFTAYKTVLQKMNGKRVIIRTLDLGADKQVPYLNLKQEDNPALGYRAIRICLDRKDIFVTQLRALLRASVYGRLAIMFPMITSVQEVLDIKEIVNQVKSGLIAENIPVTENIELGIMIETPAAVLISDLLAPLVDFFSIGTNDLTQYTLAADRLNPAVSNIFNSMHPAVLRMVQMTAKNGKEHGIWVGICGESAANQKLTPFYLAIGISELSVTPSAVLGVRKTVQQTALSQSPDEIIQQLCGGRADGVPSS